MNNQVRQLAAIMFTDIAGYTALMQKDEQNARRIRSAHRKSFDQQYAKALHELTKKY